MKEANEAYRRGASEAQLGSGALALCQRLVHLVADPLPHGALSSSPSSYPQAFNAAAIANTGSELISEIVGPAGSIKDGAFSR